MGIVGLPARSVVGQVVDGHAEACCALVVNDEVADRRRAIVCAAEEIVGAVGGRPLVERVVSVVAELVVVAGLAGDRVVARTAMDDVRAGTPAE